MSRARLLPDTSSCTFSCAVTRALPHGQSSHTAPALDEGHDTGAFTAFARHWTRVHGLIGRARPTLVAVSVGGGVVTLIEATETMGGRGDLLGSMVVPPTGSAAHSRRVTRSRIDFDIGEAPHRVTMVSIVDHSFLEART